jgi:DNA invertase Pin-like site-specific DNA recombinase
MVEAIRTRGGVNFAFYGRVSTEDAQDPAASRGWQLHRARTLIEPNGGVIVAEFFDVGLSRSVPWPGRPEAQRLLEAIKDPDRGFEAVVIGEPQRAFYSNQFSLTFPRLTHYGVALWVPEIGGPVDPSSDAHDLVMTLFGGMSKAERARIQIRVKASMRDLAETTDRFLGGRPPYGYRLVNVGPHPNPSKAVAGQQLHRLEPDPVTAPVVERIFHMYGFEELGLRAIAERLTEEGVLSPSAYDPARNGHRNPLGWAHSAVRAILMNPVYRGIRAWGKQTRVETLLDPDNPAVGLRSSMRWRDQSEWVTPVERTHEPIVNDELAALVAGRLTAYKPAGSRKPRPSGHPYCLRGLLYCGRCGSKLQGSWRPNRQPGSGRVLYRCEIKRTRALPPELADHPSTLHVREDTVLRHLDPWIESLADPEWLAVGQVPDERQEARRAGLQAELAGTERRITNLIEAIESGGDNSLLVTQLQVREAERQALMARISSLTGRPNLTPAQVKAMVAELGGIAGVLRNATTQQRAEVYGSLGLMLIYDDRSKELHVTADLARVAGRVGGGT